MSFSSLRTTRIYAVECQKKGCQIEPLFMDIKKEHIDIDSVIYKLAIKETRKLDFIL